MGYWTQNEVCLMLNYKVYIFMTIHQFIPLAFSPVKKQ